MIINAIIAILIIGFLVVAHEFGHFIVAKANGVAVVEFAIGFGPRIFHIKKGETDYALRLIPFGGACVMLGDTMMDSGDTDIEYERRKSEAEDKKELFFEGDHKIISMDSYKNPGITLVELDENNQVIRRVRVDKLPFTIGRSTENQLVLDDLCVARKHCRIVERGGQFILEDVGTANKLFVNGKMEEWVVLGDQLKIYIGNVEFLVEMGAERSHRTQLYQNAGEYYYE